MGIYLTFLLLLPPWVRTDVVKFAFSNPSCVSPVFQLLHPTDRPSHAMYGNLIVAPLYKMKPNTKPNAFPNGGTILIYPRALIDPCENA
ncbi:hypothetical protein GE09DRAFT_1091551, partial [Coniochaeta sp. 2T2.1]